MPIFNMGDEINIVNEIKENKSLVPTYDSERVDTTILNTLPGYKWEVIYLHRKIDKTTLVTQYDAKLDLTLQEYIEINGLIIYVDTPLNSGTQDALNGSGIIDIDIIPNANDLIISKLPDGRLSLFVINSIERINYNNNNLFKISYLAHSEIHDTENESYKTIVSSIYEKFIYNKDYRIDKVKPLYTLEEKDLNQKIMSSMNKLLSYWNDTFIITERGFYISYSMDNESYYDPYLENFIRNVVGLNNLNKNVEIIDSEYTNISILDYLIISDYNFSRVKKFNLINNTNIKGMSPYLMSLYYTGIDKIKDIINLDNESIVSNDLVINEYFPKIDNKFYIFREYVYKVLNGEDISIVYDKLTKFEIVFLEIMNGSVVDYKKIEEVYLEIYNLPIEEQFYFIPIYIYILKYYITTFTVKYI